VTKKIELPDELIQEIERRAAVEGKNVEDKVEAIIRFWLALEINPKVPLPIVADAAMLEERKKLAEKFITGEWGCDIERWEDLRAKDRARDQERSKNWGN